MGTGLLVRPRLLERRSKTGAEWGREETEEGVAEEEEERESGAGVEGALGAKWGRLPLRMMTGGGWGIARASKLWMRSWMRVEMLTDRCTVDIARVPRERAAGGEREKGDAKESAELDDVQRKKKSKKKSFTGNAKLIYGVRWTGIFSVFCAVESNTTRPIEDGAASMHR